MKLGVNYLMEIRDLLAEGKVDYIDYIKLYSIDNSLEPFDWCTSQRDVMFHGFIGHESNIADYNFLDDRDYDLQMDYYKRGNTPYISSHINRRVFDETGEEEVTKRIAKHVKGLKDAFGMKVILENVPDNSKRKYNDFLLYPEYISKIIYENDCGFLFDFGHARAAADYLEIPFSEYVKRLPLDRLIEVHLSGCITNKLNRPIPSHSKMNEEDYELLEELIKTCPTLEYVTLEYGPFQDLRLDEEIVVATGDESKPEIKAEVLEQLERIYEIMKKYGKK